MKFKVFEKIIHFYENFNVFNYENSRLIQYLEPGSLTEVTSFRLFRVMQFVAHHSEPGLFAFTENSDGSNQYRCHALKCVIPDAAERILCNVSQAFRRIPGKLVSYVRNTSNLIRKKI